VQKWQYLTVEISTYSAVPQVHKIDDKTLNDNGANGWELVSVVPIPESKMLQLIFKRPTR
jgi:hypothetical protein